MKQIIYIITTLFMMSLCGCNYLDIVPDDSPTLEDAFKNETTAENFVYSCYSFMPDYGDVKLNQSLFTNEMTATYHWGVQYFQFMYFQQGSISSSNPVDDLWQNCYQGIRQCFIFLDNINKVVPVAINMADYEVKKKQWLGEINFLIAYYHYVLLKHYGPIVIIDKLIPLDAGDDLMFKHRLPYDECVNQIAAMFDKAIADLPNTLQTSDYGKPSKLVAQSIKARMYLYAASPLFNGNSQYYSNFRDNKGTLLISQVPDKEKWKTAMDETLKAIQMAESLGNVNLYEYKSQNTKTLSKFDQAIANSRYTLLDKWNSEIIWAYTRYKEDPQGNSYQNFCTPTGFRVGNPLGSLGPTLKPVEIFYTKNGIPGDEDPAYDWNNRMTVAPKDSTIMLHRDREPRFYAAIGYDRGPYEINGDTITLRMRKGELNGTSNLTTGHLYGGYAVKKGIHPNNQVTANTWSINAYPITLIRLAELYLNYAEAYAEYHGKLDGDAKGYFNKIRDKAGIPSIDESFPGAATGSMTKLREIIHRERLIEFVFEGQWLYDLKRWKKAIEFFASDNTGMYGLNSNGATEKDFYQRTKLVHPMLFEQKHYLYPIKQDYVNINYNLVQNPEW